MKPTATHRPGVPASAEPPEGLLALADGLRCPLVSQCGITTTTDGRWALYVTVPAGTTVPLSDVEHCAAGFPVVYEAEPAEPVRAGPAYP